jgi:hypothetical protein
MKGIDFVMRKELKFELTKEEYMNIFSILKKLLPKDKHTFKDDYYSIKSIYFDNFDNQVLDENIIGLQYRKKFRIRMYNDDANCIFLEKKEKIIDWTKKTREYISFKEVQSICDGKLEELKLDTDLKKEFYIEMKTRLLKPIIIIEYDRVAFENKQMDYRVTLDSKLYKDKCVKNFLKKSIKKDNIYILEVKYKDVLPKIIVETLDINTQRMGISKYKMMRLNINAK